MTSLDKPVKRLTREAYRVLYVGKPRQVVVALHPGDVIVFREHGCKTKFTLPIEDAFKVAVRRAALTEIAEKKKQKLIKKRGY
jgi:hypothetical protein